MNPLSTLAVHCESTPATSVKPSLCVVSFVVVGRTRAIWRSDTFIVFKPFAAISKRDEEIQLV